MRKRGFTLVEIMIVVAIIALLAAIAIPNLLQARRTANDAAAQANIRTLSTAAETYSAANSGVYPASVVLLTGYAASTGQFCADAAGGLTLLQGYNYGCTLAATGYTITASAATCGTTGSRNLTITTGGVLTSIACT